MKNREVFQRDPAATKLLNDGVAAVGEARTPKEVETLRYGENPHQPAARYRRPGERPATGCRVRASMTCGAAPRG